MAMLAWQDAFEAAKLVRERDPMISDTAFNCIAAGIVTLYSRPFGSNNGVGPIPKDFETFPSDPESRKLHSQHLYLLLLRHKVFAHFDLPANAQHMKKIEGAKNPEEIALILSTKGFKISCSMLLLGRFHLVDVMELITFQRRRLQIQLEKALYAYFDGNVPVGHFRITNDGIKLAEPGAKQSRGSSITLGKSIDDIECASSDSQ